MCKKILSAGLLFLMICSLEACGTTGKQNTVPLDTSENSSYESVEATTREYEIGDFGYWNAGPDLAIFYDDIYEQTIVEAVSYTHLTLPTT